MNSAPPHEISQTTPSNQHEIDITSSNHDNAPRNIFGILLAIIILFICFVCQVCLLVASKLLYVLIIIACIIVAPLIALPLLIVSFFITRFLQFIFGCGKAYDVATQLNLVILTWININGFMLMCELALFYGVVHIIPPLNAHFRHVMVLGLPLMKLIMTYFIIYGIYFMSYFLSIIIIRCVMFHIPLKHHTYRSGSLVIPHSVHEIISCLIFGFAEHLIMERHPVLKDYKIFGIYPIHRSIHVVIIVLVLHNLITLSIYNIVWQLHHLVIRHEELGKPSIRYLMTKKVWGRKSLVYWADGTKHGTIFVFSMVMLFLTWDLYFGLTLEEHGTAKAKKVLEFGNWTCLTLLIYSFLWLIKTCILLLLEDRAIYSRLDTRIIKVAKQLYFLGVIGRHKYDIFELLYTARPTTSKSLISISNLSNIVCSDFKSSKDGFIQKSIKTFNCKDYTEDCSNICDRKRGISILMLSIFPLTLIKTHQCFRDHGLDPEDNWPMSGDQQGDQQIVDDQKKVPKLSWQKKKRVKDDLLMHEEKTPTLYELQQMAHYFLAAREKVLQDKHTSDQIQKYMQHEVDQGKFNENDLKKLIEAGEKDPKKEGHSDHIEAGKGLKSKDGVPKKEELISDWNYFKREVLRLHASEPPLDRSLDALEQPLDKTQIATWMRKALNQCEILANTLASAKGLVECWDKIMSGVLIAGAFILWLLLTELASYKVIGLIFAPLLAVNFIIGDTCKAYFQGFVFVYLVNPFEVGDLCVIDKDMLEVRTIGVWKTTFIKVDTQVEVIYPNTDLMNKRIANHKTGFDWNYSVELHVGSLDNKKINKLKFDIDKHLKAKYKDGIVEVLTTAEKNIKIVVTFQHQAYDEHTHSYDECFKEKRRLQSEFVCEVQRFMDEINRTDIDPSEIIIIRE